MKKIIFFILIFQFFLIGFSVADISEKTDDLMSNDELIALGIENVDINVNDFSIEESVNDESKITEDELKALGVFQVDDKDINFKLNKEIDNEYDNLTDIELAALGIVVEDNNNILVDDNSNYYYLFIILVFLVIGFIVIYFIYFREILIEKN